jgi:PEGA domain-containing protein
MTKRAVYYSFLVVTLIACIDSAAQLTFGQGAGRPQPTPTPSGPTRSKVNRLVTRVRMNRVSSERRVIEKKGSLDPVSLWVISRPPNSKVFVDGEPRGDTNTAGELELKLLPGLHVIRVALDGYLANTGEVEVTSATDGREVEFELTLALTTLNVVTDPSEAEVYLDDVYKGATNAAGLLVIERINPTQKHILRVRKAGFIQQTNPVTSYAGQMSIKLLSVSSPLKINSDPAEAEIYLDDIYKGTTTPEGALVIDQVNPNQPHTLRAKKAGFLQQSVSVAPLSTESSIKLPPDPIVLLVKRIKQNLVNGERLQAFAGYTQLNHDAPDHPELPRLLDSLLQSLQVRSTELLKQVGAFGLAIQPNDLEEIYQLYTDGKKWRPGDEALEVLAKYWELRYLLTKSDTAKSVSEKQSLLNSARSRLTELSDRGLRNQYLLLELGWGWVRFNDRAAAQKQFVAAQELRPDWAYPHFAQGYLAMNAGENETNKSARTQKYGLAIESFTKAITLKHDFSRAYASKAIAFALLKRHEESTASGFQAIAVEPQSAFAHYALGFAYFQKGKSSYRNARDEFNRALALDNVELEDQTKASIQQLLAVIKKAIK